MSSFKPNQQATWGSRELPVTIVAGPFNQERPIRTQWYAIQDGTHETWAYANDLRPMLPKAGDQGYLESDAYSYTIEYMSDEVVLLWRRPSVSHGKAWRSVTRGHFDQDWRPES